MKNLSVRHFAPLLLALLMCCANSSGAAVFTWVCKNRGVDSLPISNDARNWKITSGWSSSPQPGPEDSLVLTQCEGVTQQNLEFRRSSGVYSQYISFDKITIKPGANFVTIANLNINPPKNIIEHGGMVLMSRHIFECRHQI